MNTRFNPTCNGRLHIGHAYLALVNYHAAKSTGGRFCVRFDDDQRYWLERLSRPVVNGFSAMIRDDLEWLGIAADLYSSEASEREANEAWLDGRLPKLEHGEDIGFPTPTIKTCDRPYPYVPYLTAVKVVQDYREGIDTLIRGDDLVSEFSLYQYFCRLLGMKAPRFVYVPKLMHGGDDLSDVSKTKGNFKIATFRETGWRPDEVIGLLAESCLIDKAGPWSYENVRMQPAIGPVENYR